MSLCSTGLFFCLFACRSSLTGAGQPGGNPCTYRLQWKRFRFSTQCFSGSASSHTTRCKYFYSRNLNIFSSLIAKYFSIFDRILNSLCSICFFFVYPAYFWFCYKQEKMHLISGKCEKLLKEDLILKYNYYSLSYCIVWLLKCDFFLHKWLMTWFVSLHIE